MKQRRGYEVHEHSYVSGPNANVCGRKLVHSHEGGNEPHQHEHVGPASFTIDKDEWFRATGLRGGGRKKFTRAPSGEQLAMVPLADSQLRYDIIIVGDGGASAATGTGPGIAPVARLKLACGATPRSVRRLP